MCLTFFNFKGQLNGSDEEYNNDNSVRLLTFFQN